MPVASARKVGALIYQMIEDMKFSYEEKDAYRVTWRDPRQMYVKYMYVAMKASSYFPSSCSH